MSDMKAGEVTVVKTVPIAGQAFGTSGLRKKVVEFQKPNYLENVVQSIFNSLPSNELQGSTLFLSGDGRYFNQEASHTIIRMAAANGVSRILCGTHFLVSTPCVSALVRQFKCYGAIILTASHNPGGPDEDFGIKYNTSNGGPAAENITNEIYKHTQAIADYKIMSEQPKFDVSRVGQYKFGSLTIEVVDAPKEYAKLMKSIFDFDALRELIGRKDFSFVYDAMHGVAGPFATEVFVNELGADPSCIINGAPSLDFGKGHPDPNLTYAHELVERMGLDPEHKPQSRDTIPDFGAAADGDADRNMVLGREFFVTPSDSVAIIAANASCIPYFARGGVKGVARSMPTSAALDRVASKLGVQCYEVPTGWKFFGNLMDAGKLSICGEESFGTGSDHIREKDGLWAVLAWLQILHHKNKHTPQGSPLVSVKDIVLDHWKTYGRNYYSRYDYEQVDSDAANKVMAGLMELVQKASENKDYRMDDYTVGKADNFSYTDPVDHSVSKNQGIRFIFTDGSRVVYRLSGTGSVGATIRVYIEKYESDQSKLEQETQNALQPLIKIALEISKIAELTGRQKPTVIT